MTDEEARNIGAVMAQHEHWAAHRVDALVAQWADPAHNHGRPAPHGVMRSIFVDILDTFPDLDFPVEAAVAKGDTVIARCRFRGTHRGVGRLPVNGGLLIGVPPTERTMDVQHIHWYVLKDGLITAHWANRDDVGMMQQLGLLPKPDFDYRQWGVAPPR